MKNFLRFTFWYIAFISLLACAALAQVPQPQVPIGGTIGENGINPLLPSGTIASSDANYTVAYPNTSGVVISVTGTWTAARTWTFPSTGMTYNVCNNTTGGFAMNISPSSGLSIANGTCSFIWYNGTNYVAINPPSSGGGSVNVNGSAVSSPNFNGTTPAAGSGFQNSTLQVSGSNVSSENPLASSSAFGLAKVDGTTITASGGVISAVGGGGSIATSVNLLNHGGTVYADSVPTSQAPIIHAGGDSYEAGFGAFTNCGPANNQSCAPLAALGRDFNLDPSTLTNYAIAGSVTTDTAYQFCTNENPQLTGNNEAIVMTTGTNDVGNGTGATTIADYRRALATVAICGTMPNGVLAGNALVTLSGTTATESTFPPAVGKTCSVTTCTATYTNAIVGASGIVIIQFETHASGANISMTANSVAQTDQLGAGAWTTSIPTAWTIAPLHSGANTVSLTSAIFTGLTPGANTLVVTWSNGDTFNRFFLPQGTRYRGPSVVNMALAGPSFQPGLNPTYLSAYETAAFNMWANLIVPTGAPVRFWDSLNIGPDPNCDWMNTGNPAPYNVPSTACPASGYALHPNSPGYELMGLTQGSTLGLVPASTNAYIAGNAKVLGSTGLYVSPGNIDLGPTTGNGICVWDAGTPCTLSPAAGQAGIAPGGSNTVNLFSAGGMNASDATGVYLSAVRGTGTTVPGPLTVGSTSSQSLVQGPLTVSGEITVNGGNGVSMNGGYAVVAPGGGNSLLLNGYGGVDFCILTCSSNVATITSSGLTMVGAAGITSGTGGITDNGALSVNGATTVGGVFGISMDSGDVTINPGGGNSMSLVGLGGVQLGNGSAIALESNSSNALIIPGQTGYPYANGSSPLTYSTTIPNSALATQTANTVLGALTATTPSGLALPSCSGASNALTYTTGTGFGCNSISSGFANPMTTLGDTIYGAGSGVPTRLAGPASPGTYVLTEIPSSSTPTNPAWLSTLGSGAYIVTSASAPSSYTAGNALTTDAGHNIFPSSYVLPVSSSATAGSLGTNVTSATCATATCTNLRGTYTVVTATGYAGGSLFALSWTATATAYVCTASIQATPGGLTHSVATTTGFSITATSVENSGTYAIDYSCQP